MNELSRVVSDFVPKMLKQSPKLVYSSETEIKESEEGFWKKDSLLEEQGLFKKKLKCS